MLTPREQDQKFQQIFEKVNRLLLDLGWMLPGRMQGYEVSRVEELLDRYHVAQVSGQSEKPLSKIQDLMIAYVHSPAHRSYAVFRMANEHTTRRVAHHLEAATLHYYKGDYFSCALTILPMVEGMLLSRMGWSAASGERLPNARRVRESLISTQASVAALEARATLHRKALIAFMERWIFSSHADIDTEVTYLNRHYALHCMGDGCFYTAADCQRLFNFVDVYLDLRGYETGIGLGPFIPETPFIAERVLHYIHLTEGNISIRASRAIEAKFMASHGSFVPETDPPDLHKIVKRKEAEFQEMLAEAKARMGGPT